MPLISEPVRFTIGPSGLGSLLVAAGHNGVLFIGFADDAALPVSQLLSRYPQAVQTGADGELAQAHAALVAFVEAPDDGVALKLDLRGTAFQQRVWAALREIPCGHTWTYSELARRIGAPRAVRAAAAACGANPLPLVIPCHRVIGANGSLTGYRWGLASKAALLERESRAAG